MRVEHPISGRLQQGAFFNCAIVPGYEDCQCYGLILTARCDLEHEKYSAISYLSVIQFSDWVKRELCFVLARRNFKSIKSHIYRTLKDNKVPEFVFNTFPLKDIIEKETSGKEKVSLLDKLECLQLIESVLSKNTLYSRELIQKYITDCDALVNDLIRGKLPEYYFINAVDTAVDGNDRSSGGYVVLLRNMRILSPKTACKIIAGIEENDAKSDTVLMSTLTFAHEPICMVTGVLRSPDIEHLAQSFANLFVRIGIEDHEEQTIENHKNIAKGHEICRK